MSLKSTMAAVAEWYNEADDLEPSPRDIAVVLTAVILPVMIPLAVPYYFIALANDKSNADVVSEAAQKTKCDAPTTASFTESGRSLKVTLPQGCSFNPR